MENFDFENEQSFQYLDECHTSVVGLRELAPNFQVVSAENIIENLKISKNYGGLLAIPAMSNFSGAKFPIKQWITKAHENKFKVILGTWPMSSLQKYK